MVNILFEIQKFKKAKKKFEKKNITMFTVAVN